MELIDLPALVDELLANARTSSAQRSAHTVHGGREHHLRQTVVALAEGGELADHESPGEATLQVLHGRITMTAGDETWEGRAGSYVLIPPARHRVDALEDSAFLLTVSVATRRS